MRNSSRVLAEVRKQPNMVEVTVEAEALCTPLITIHMWLASMTTATPCGWIASSIARAICLVIRSCTWRRRPNVSASLASLDKPRTFLLGM